MNPGDLLLAEHITEDEYKTLSPQAQVVWMSRPSREHVVRSVYFMRLRVAMIVAVSLYFACFHKDIGEGNILLFVLACYEFAYHNVRKQKSELDYLLARETYVAKVEAVVSEERRAS